MLRNEIKYLLTYEEYLILSARIRAVLPMDKHAKDPSGYMISSLYLDDQYNSSYYEKAAGTADRRKYRLRAYNFDDSFITLECKEKQKNQEQNVKRKFRYYDFGTPRDAFEFTSSCDNQCPLCGKTLILKTEYYRKYYNQFSAVRECEEHGCFCENIIVAKINEKLVNSKFKSVKTLHRAANFDTAMRLVKVKKRRRQNRQKPAGIINE